MKGSVIVIAGIDTGIGKTFATGLLARALLQNGKNVITQKIVQTGCEGVSEDIVEHRRLMGTGLLEVDREGLTCPYVFRYPASPHLSARLDGTEIDLMRIRRCTLALQKRYELILLEGVGGLLVPLADELLFADYVRDAGYGLLLVTSPRLGSINHTLLSIEACVKRGIVLRGIIYNSFQPAAKLIVDDTRYLIQRALHNAGYCAPVVNLYDGILDADAIDRLSL
ncbi:MAG: dethiobiotin synthase [Chlorobium sp.]